MTLSCIVVFFYHSIDPNTPLPVSRQSPHLTDPSLLILYSSLGRRTRLDESTGGYATEAAQVTAAQDDEVVQNMRRAANRSAMPVDNATRCQQRQQQREEQRQKREELQKLKQQRQQQREEQQRQKLQKIKREQAEEAQAAAAVEELSKVKALTKKAAEAARAAHGADATEEAEAAAAGTKAELTEAIESLETTCKGLEHLSQRDLIRLCERYVFFNFSNWYGSGRSKASLASRLINSAKSAAKEALGITAMQVAAEAADAAAKTEVISVFKSLTAEQCAKRVLPKTNRPRYTGYFISNRVTGAAAADLMDQGAVAVEHYLAAIGIKNRAHRASIRGKIRTEMHG